MHKCKEKPFLDINTIRAGFWIVVAFLKNYHIKCYKGGKNLAKFFILIIPSVITSLPYHASFLNYNLKKNYIIFLGLFWLTIASRWVVRYETNRKNTIKWMGCHAMSKLLHFTSSSSRPKTIASLSTSFLILLWLWNGDLWLSDSDEVESE